jgi:hypothetical protein
MRERALLRVDYRAILRGVRDLENDSTGRRVDKKILIALASELDRSSGDVEVFTRQTLGVRGREARCVGKHA